MNRREATQVVARLAAANPAWKATEATVALWCDMIGDLDFADTERAVSRLIATSTDWPSIATVRRTVAELNGLTATPVDVACRLFLAAARQGVRPDDRLILDTIEALGGWHHVRTATNPSVLLGQFRALYADAAARHDAAACSDTLPQLAAARERPQIEGPR